jgi:hypothetical protein
MKRKLVPEGLIKRLLGDPLDRIEPFLPDLIGAWHKIRLFPKPQAVAVDPVSVARNLLIGGGVVVGLTRSG